MEDKRFSYKGEERYTIFGQTSTLYALSDEGGAAAENIFSLYSLISYFHPFEYGRQFPIQI